MADGVGEIDPEIASFVAALLAASAQHPDLASRDYPSQRAIIAGNRARWREGGPIVGRREARTLATRAGDVGVRILATDDAGGTERPALVYVHGGGFTYFSLDTHDRLMREYAARTGAVVIGVDYSLSPEAKFPTALHEVAGVVRWLLEHGATLGVDRRRVAIGGDSAGANLALATALMLRDGGERPRLAGLLLNYGFFDADLTTESQRRHGGPGKLLTREELAVYLDNYLGGTEHGANPLALPALAALHDLPPSVHVIAECDPLADGDRAMAAKLKEAGNQVEVQLYRGATHSFLEAVSISSIADRALSESSRWLRTAWGAMAA